MLRHILVLHLVKYALTLLYLYAAVLDRLGYSANAESFPHWGNIFNILLLVSEMIQRKKSLSYPCFITTLMLKKGLVENT